MKKFIGILLTLLFYTACQQKDADKGLIDTRPNIILFYSDELDPLYLSAYGGEFPTPHLDQLASEGIRFTSAYTVSPMCTPSRFALLTGKYPGRCQHPLFKETYPPDEPYVIAWNTYLGGDMPTIAHVLSRNGYYTGMAGKWHIGYLPDEVNIPSFSADDDPDDPQVEQKLKDYHQIVSEQVKRDAGFDVAGSVLWANYDNFPVTSLRTHNFPWITNGAVEFLEAAKKQQKPFFLYVATTAVHGPGHAEAFDKDLRYTLEGRKEDILKYQLPADSMRKVLNGLPSQMRHKYAGIACLDNHVNKVMEKLHQLDMEKETLIIFMADHNVEPGKATCYEKGLKVPLIIRMPGGTFGGTVNHKPVSSIDLFPTILQAAQIPIPEGLQLDGISLMPMIRSDSVYSRQYVFGESGLTRSVCDGRWKYIAFRYPGAVVDSMKHGSIDYAPNFLNLERQAHSSIAMEHFPGYFDADQLYDLTTDPYEQSNLAYKPKYADQLRQMQDVLINHLLSFEHPYDLSDTTYMRSDDYRKKTSKSLSIGTAYIPWLARDHGRIIWPPEE